MGAGPIKSATHQLALPQIAAGSVRVVEIAAHTHPGAIRVDARDPRLLLLLLMLRRVSCAGAVHSSGRAAEGTRVRGIRSVGGVHGSGGGGSSGRRHGIRVGRLRRLLRLRGHRRLR